MILTYILDAECKKPCSLKDICYFPFIQKEKLRSLEKEEIKKILTKFSSYADKKREEKKIDLVIGRNQSIERLYEIARIAKYYGYKVRVSINEEIRLDELPTDEVVFNWSSDKEIKRNGEIIKRIKESKKGVKTEIYCCITKKNLANIKDYVERALAIGVDNLTGILVVPQTKEAFREFMPSYDSFRKMLRELDSFLKEKKARMRIDAAPNLEEEGFSSLDFTQCKEDDLDVYPNGDVFAICDVCPRAGSVGNILYDNLETIVKEIEDFPVEKDKEFGCYARGFILNELT